MAPSVPTAAGAAPSSSASLRAPSGLLRTACGDALGPVSTLQIQQWIEAAWAEGYDPKGCADFGGSLVGKPIRHSPIGAPELLIALSASRALPQILDRTPAWHWQAWLSVGGA